MKTGTITMLRKIIFTSSYTQKQQISPQTDTVFFLYQF